MGRSYEDAYAGFGATSAFGFSTYEAVRWSGSRSAGIGTASDATIAMELGCDGVLINSAIANAKKPILMAEAFKDAVISGRKSYLAGRMSKKYLASPSSPFRGLI